MRFLVLDAGSLGRYLGGRSSRLERMSPFSYSFRDARPPTPGMELAERGLEAGGQARLMGVTGIEVSMTSATKKLEVFQDLFLRGPAARGAALRQALLDRLVQPWRHAEERERRLSKASGSDADILAFQREASDGLAEATLTLWSQPDGYKVSNIVPLEIGQLGYAGYNAILQDFEQRIAAPAAQQVGFRVEMTAACQSIEDWLSPKAAGALWRFSRAANKSTGSAHPLDRERWLQFVIEAHSAKDHLDPDSLARWLTEVEGWDDEHARELAIDYEKERELLRKYDHHRS